MDQVFATSSRAPLRPRVGLTPSQAAGSALTTWWVSSDERASRDLLPWRSLADPWGVLVSEVMLAQTQAGRVAERFPGFLRRFPSPCSMAAASPGEVIAAWSGLGYYRRAEALHRCASSIVDLHGGEVPRSLDELLALPGIGRYTARAVLAFAFGEHSAPVDTNIFRVLARAFAGRRLSSGEAQATADRLVPEHRAREWSLAMMDLGAVICTKRAPRCEACPLGVNRACAWRATGVRSDPAAASAGSSRGPGFAGSDREARGRLIRAVTAGPVLASEVAAVAGFPEDPARARRVTSGLVVDRLLDRLADGTLRLP